MQKCFCNDLIKKVLFLLAVKTVVTSKSYSWWVTITNVASIRMKLVSLGRKGKLGLVDQLPLVDSAGAFDVWILSVITVKLFIENRLPTITAGNESFVNQFCEKKITVVKFMSKKIN